MLYIFYNSRFKQWGGCLIARRLVDPRSSSLIIPLGCTQIYDFSEKQTRLWHSWYAWIYPRKIEMFTTDGGYGRKEIHLDQNLSTIPLSSNIHTEIYIFGEFSKKCFLMGTFSIFWIETTEEIPIGIFRV